MGVHQLFEVETVPESDLGLRTALEADAVVLLNIGRLSAGAAELLEGYHAGGGNIVIVLGDRADARRTDAGNRDLDMP